MKTRLFILIFALVASAGTLFAESGTLLIRNSYQFAKRVKDKCVETREAVEKS